jgi:hypothetical protein|tara:strand:+ start:256 stop:702 length:447 start_codon:yes stop_codon:yes gene_type:complete
MAYNPTGWELLKANSGSNNTTSDNNFDTVAIRDFTAKDCLQIYWMLTVTTANLIDPRLWNDTDSTQCGGITENNLTAGTSSIGCSMLRIDGTNLTTIGFIPNGTNAVGSSFSVSTAWTADWTLAMRGQNSSSGVTKWAWSVYKVRGTV